MNAKHNKTELPNPKALVEAFKAFADEETALRFMVSLRWGGSDKVFKTNTMMEESPLPVGTWLMGIWLEANAKNSISSYEVYRSLGITQKSAWFMQQRIRLAMQNSVFLSN